MPNKKSSDRCEMASTWIVNIIRHEIKLGYTQSLCCWRKYNTDYYSTPIDTEEQITYHSKTVVPPWSLHSAGCPTYCLWNRLATMEVTSVAVCATVPVAALIVPVLLSGACHTGTIRIEGPPYCSTHNATRYKTVPSFRGHILLITWS